MFFLLFCSFIVFLLELVFGPWFVICSLCMLLFFVPWWFPQCINTFFVLDVVLSFRSLLCIKVVVVFCPLVLLCWACACVFVLGLALSLWILGYCSGGLFVLPFCSLIVFLILFGFGRWFVIRSLWMVLFFVPWWLSLCLNSFFVLDVVLSCCPLFCIQVAIVVCSLGLLVWACAYFFVLDFVFC